MKQITRDDLERRYGYYLQFLSRQVDLSRTHPPGPKSGLTWSSSTFSGDERIGAPSRWRNRSINCAAWPSCSRLTLLRSRISSKTSRSSRARKSDLTRSLRARR